MRKGTYISYHVIMVCLTQKRKKRRQQSIDKLLAKAQAGNASMDQVLNSTAMETQAFLY